MKTQYLILLACLLTTTISAQSPFIGNLRDFNPIRTAVPFALIDAKPYHLGMGEVGVVNMSGNGQSALTQNPALLTANNRQLDVHATYMPWLDGSNGGDPIYFRGLGVMLQANERHALGLNIKDFELGSSFAIDFFTGDTIDLQPTEWLTSLSYAYQLHPNWSIGAGLKYVKSDPLRDGEEIFEGYEAINTLMFDLGVHFHSMQQLSNGLALHWSAGLSFQNMGPKVGYFQGDFAQSYSPAIIRLGGAFRLTKELNDNHGFDIGMSLQFDKLMVPTPCNCDDDENFVADYLEKSALEGMLTSFTDDHHGGEDFREIIRKIGMEMGYSYRDLRASLRFGYRYEDPSKGNRTFWSFGSGLSYKGIYVDAAFVIDDGANDPFRGRMPGAEKISLGVGYRCNIHSPRDL
ncbi:MAG: PorV/PorQ family protein [Bacteroidota bacterium]